jgi:glycosyltransferase involved in cell wall biosynthesis
MIAVCIPTSFKRKKYYEELLKCLKNQTFKDFKVYSVYDVTPIGKAKHDVVELALKDKPEYIQMIDDDDLVEPKFLEMSYAVSKSNDLDWVVTWGKCFGDRKGEIHGYSLPFNTHRSLNRMNSWGMFNSRVFQKCHYRPSIKFAEDWDLWLQLRVAGFIKGGVIPQELYLQRWHDKNLNNTEKYNYREMRSNILKLNGLPDVKYRFHIPAYVHLPCSERYMACAFTQKIVKLSKMLLSLGHEVYIYGAEGSDAPCTEFIQTHTLADIRKEWGDGDNRFEIGYDYKTFGFRHDFNEKKTDTTKKFYAKCIEEINKRKLDDDFILLMQGTYHTPISDKVNLLLTCEPGIGYRGSSKDSWRAFESLFLQSFTYGSENPFGDCNGNHYDRVIPNYFDPKDFTFKETKGDYYLYIGRMIKRKGVFTATEATRATGKRLILVGQTDPEIDVSQLPKHCEYRGFADIEQRKELLANAIAVFTPTDYLEPFAGTHVEAMLSGTPPITTDFGVFPGTIPDCVNGIVGFRCNTLQDFVDAAIKAKTVDHKAIRKYAEQFLMDNVKLKFQKWFDDLYQWYLSTDGKTPGWHYLRPEFRGIDYGK